MPFSLAALRPFLISCSLFCTKSDGVKTCQTMSLRFSKVSAGSASPHHGTQKHTGHGVRSRPKGHPASNDFCLGRGSLWTAARAPPSRPLNAPAFPGQGHRPWTPHPKRKTLIFFLLSLGPSLKRHVAFLHHAACGSFPAEYKLRGESSHAETSVFPL